MHKADIFDEVILCLSEAAKNQADFSISPDVMEQLFAPLPPRSGMEPPKPVEMVQPRPQHSAVRAASAVPQQQMQAFAAMPDVSQSGWEELEQTAAACRCCPLWAGRTNPVFGSGNRNAELMFIGEGPGADEDAQGLPFVGRAGELLTRMITAMQFDRESEVYIANVVKCRPPGNRTPVEEEANVCRTYLFRQIELVSPKIIVTLGATPLKYLFGLQGITKLRGKWLDYRGIKVMPTYHPAYLLRDPNKKKDVWYDLQLVMREFGRFPQR